jgi:predicted house-cleaning noncanonical NTP pyrophosphatase (MazG superfamily)
MRKGKIPDVRTIDVEEYADFFFSLKQKELTLQDLGIENKKFHDWRYQEIVPPNQLKNKRENYKDLRFSFFEEVWMYIVRDMRMMGVTYTNIRKLREEFWTLIPKETLEQLFSENLNEISEISNQTQPTFKNLVNQIKKRYKEMGGFDPRVFHETFVFENLVVSCLLSGQETKLLLRYDGMTGILNETPAVKSFDGEIISVKEIYNRDFAPFPHISVPLEKYLRDFFSDDLTAKQLPLFGFVTQDESEVLEVIRTKNIRELKVTMNQATNAIQTIEFTEDRDITKEEMYQLTRTFFLKQYESVSFKAKSNKTVYFEKTIRKNLQ